MERSMRRFKQMLSDQAVKEILENGSNGVLSLVDTDGEAYGVPINYAYDGNKCIYFHSAPKGHKIECISANNRASFCVVGQDLIVPEEFTSYFRSVIVRGKIQVVDSHVEMMKGLLLLCEKFAPGIDPQNEISKCLSHVAVLRLDIENVTGKEAIEIVRKRQEATQ